MPASEPSEEHDDPGQYANVNGEEDASTNIERGNCHARPHMIRTQNTRCALAVPKSWIIDQKVARDVGLRSPGAEFARQGVIEPDRATSTGFQGLRCVGKQRCARVVRSIVWAHKRYSVNARLLRH